MNFGTISLSALRSSGFVLAASLLAVSSFGEEAHKRIRSATESFDEIMRIPEKGIPRDLLDKAECVVIIPGLKKGAFLVGGKYG